jgi:hypothetical protein
MQRNIISTGFTLAVASSEVILTMPSFVIPYDVMLIDLAGHASTIGTLSYAIRFWSKGTKRALFLRHEGFL